MKVVVDTNIIFAALLRENSRLLEHLLLSSTEFYSMRFVVVELFKHKERIVQHSQLPENEMLDFLHRILTNIRFVDEQLISIKSYTLAYRYCHETDIKDLPFLALAIDLDAPLWTMDKKLIEGTLSKGFSNFYQMN
jgi:predicted nucleic acid-binding protein